MGTWTNARMQIHIYACTIGKKLKNAQNKKDRKQLDTYTGGLFLRA